MPANCMQSVSRYSPGDVAVIHPVTSTDEVEIFLTAMNWGNFADSPLKIKRTMEGWSLL